jgi:hypothetical protein
MNFPQKYFQDVTLKFVTDYDEMIFGLRSCFLASIIIMKNITNCEQNLKLTLYYFLLLEDANLQHISFQDIFTYC